jgi:nucleotide-binding universal stress UspA family protein
MRVLVGIDFSNPSRVALTAAAWLSRQSGAELHVVHIEDRLLHAAAREQGWDLSGETLDELRRFVLEAAPGIEARYHIGAGSTVEALLAAANGIKADMVVAGAHGMSRAARLMFGSTTEGLLRKSSRLVLVVPEQWTA